MMILPQLLPATSQLPAGGWDSLAPEAVPGAGVVLSFDALLSQRAAVAMPDGVRTDGKEGGAPAPPVALAAIGSTENWPTEHHILTQGAGVDRGKAAAPWCDSGASQPLSDQSDWQAEPRSDENAETGVRPKSHDGAQKPVVRAQDPQPKDPGVWLTREAASHGFPQAAVVPVKVDHAKIVEPAEEHTPIIAQAFSTGPEQPEATSPHTLAQPAVLSAGQEYAIADGPSPVVPSASLWHRTAVNGANAEAAPVALAFIEGSIFGNAASARSTEPEAAPEPEGAVMAAGTRGSMIAPAADIFPAELTDRPAEIAHGRFEHVQATRAKTASPVEASGSASSSPVRAALPYAREPAGSTGDHAGATAEVRTTGAPIGARALPSEPTASPAYAPSFKPAVIPAASGPRSGRMAGASPPAMQRKAEAETLPLNVTAFLGSDGV